MFQRRATAHSLEADELVELSVEARFGPAVGFQAQTAGISARIIS
jgi:hypothetical protein